MEYDTVYIKIKNMQNNIMHVYCIYYLCIYAHVGKIFLMHGNDKHQMQGKDYLWNVRKVNEVGGRTSLGGR